MAAGNTKMCGVVDKLWERDDIQRDLFRTEGWVCANLTTFNKTKCKILHLGRDNSKNKYRLRGEWIKTSPGKKDLGVFVEKSSNYPAM